VDRFVPLLSFDAVPCGVAVDGRYIYWADEVKGAIGRARDDGTGRLDPSFILGASLPCGVAASRHHLYWANKGRYGSIGRSDLDGPASVQENFVPSDWPRHLRMGSKRHAVAATAGRSLSAVRCLRAAGLVASRGQSSGNRS
jgi:hypothetical protein